MRNGPPLQNIPLRTEEAKRLREAFTPEVSMAVDYAVVERRAAEMMGTPSCPQCGAPLRAEGDGALCDSFITCGCSR